MITRPIQPAALRAAVALLTAELGAVDIDPAALLENVDSGDVIAALTIMTGLLLTIATTPHITEVMLRTAGHTAAEHH